MTESAIATPNLRKGKKKNTAIVGVNDINHRSVLKGRCGSKNASFLQNFRFLIFTCFDKIITSTVLKKKKYTPRPTWTCFKFASKEL